MFDTHFLTLLTLELLALIAALFLLIYVNKQSLGKWYRHLSKTIIITLHVIIAATIIHGVFYHFHRQNETLHNEMMRQHLNH